MERNSTVRDGFTQVILWSEHIEAAWGQCLVDFRKQPIARRKSPDQYDVGDGFIR